VPATDLGATTIADLSSLPIVNNGNSHWESFTGTPASDNLLATGAIYPNSNGLNFLWINGAGGAVAERLGSHAFFYFSTADGGTGPTIYGGDITFQGQPVPALAQFVLVYLEAGMYSDGGGPAVDVWTNSVVCTP
jgi:hypothetical protein